MINVCAATFSGAILAITLGSAMGETLPALDPVMMSGSIERGNFDGNHAAVYNPLAGNISYSDAEGYTSSIVFDTVRGVVSISSTDPGHAYTTLPFGPTIFADAKLEYQIRFNGAAGPLSVAVQAAGSRTGLSGVDLEIDNDASGSDVFDAFGDTSTPPYSSSYNTHNAVVSFESGVVYDVSLFAGVAGSGTAYIDPTFTILTPGYTLSASPGVQVGPVPLPASAPLFGAGLIGLAGVGYVVRRKTAAIV